MFLLWLMFVLTATPIFSSPIPTTPLERTITLSSNFTLSWTVDTATDNVRFSALVGSVGWVGFGFSYSGTIVGADIMVLHVVGDGFVCGDYWCEIDQIDKDETYYKTIWRPLVQDCSLIYAERNNTHTYLIWERDVLTCDNFDIEITIDPNYVIYALGPTDDFVSPETVPWGTILIPFLTSPLDPALFSNDLDPQIPTNTWIPISFLSGAPLNIPYYTCSSTTFTPSTPSVLSGWPPIVPTYIDEMTLYLCDKPQPQYNGSRTCTSIGSHPGCNFLVTWTRGMAYILPLHMGISLPIPSTILVELRYNQSTVASEVAIVISSEEPDVYTAEFRWAKGLMAINISPNADSYTISTEITAAWTSEYIPTSGINLLSTTLNMHKLGISGYIQIIRDGIEFNDIEKIYFDPNLQTPLVHTEPIQVMPGDTLIGHCSYNSSQKSITTLGGWDDDSEICSWIFLYYPPLVVSSVTDFGAFITSDPSLNLNITEAEINAILKNGITPNNKTIYTDFGVSYVSLADREDAPLCLTVSQTLIPDPFYIGQLAPGMVIFYVIISGIAVFLHKGLKERSQFFRTMKKTNRRNSITYMLQLIITTPLLFFIFITLYPLLFWIREATVDEMHLAEYAFTIIVVLYTWELGYRLNINTGLLVHHLITIIFSVLVTFTYFQTEEQGLVAIGLIFLLYAVLEQPSFIGLLLYRWKLKGSIVSLKIAAVCTVLFKTATFCWILVAVIKYLYLIRATIRSWIPDEHADAWRLTWSIILPPLLVALFAVQLQAAWILWQIAVRAEQREKRKLEEAQGKPLEAPYVEMQDVKNR